MNHPKHTGKLYLIPTPITSDSLSSIPASTIAQIHRLRYFIAERARTSRRFIKTTNPPFQIADITVEEMPRKIESRSIELLLKPLLNGHDMGFMSEAGCPGVADPGSHFVAYCHKNHIQVVPLTGPSSILLALMGSGMNGQKFTFNGYLPAKKEALKQRLKQLEQRVQKHNETQIFIETPYRNRQIVEEAQHHLQQNTLFCVALHLNADNEWIKTAPISQWKTFKIPEIHKIPAIFLIGKTL